MRQTSPSESKRLIRLLYAFFNIPLTEHRVESYLSAHATLGYHRWKGLAVFKANPSAQLPPIGIIANILRLGTPVSSLQYNTATQPGRASALKTVRMLTAGSSTYVLLNGSDKDSDIGVKVIGNVLQPNEWDELLGPAPFERYVFEVYGHSILWAAVIDCDDTGKIFSARS